MSVPLDRVLGLLDEIKQVAQTASMTGSLDGGARMLIALYNKCLEAVAEEPGVGDLFPKLDAVSANGSEAGMDEVGVAAALLAGYLRPRPNVQARHVRIGSALTTITANTGRPRPNVQARHVRVGSGQE